MVNRYRITKIAPLPSRWIFPRLLATGFIGLSSLVCQLAAQTPPLAAYPATPTASAGMTSGIPGASDYEQGQMAKIRTAAQNAQSQAAAASIARSADQALEKQHTQRLLQSAREIRCCAKLAAGRRTWLGINMGFLGQEPAVAGVVLGRRTRSPWYPRPNRQNQR